MTSSTPPLVRDYLDLARRLRSVVRGGDEDEATRLRERLRRLYASLDATTRDCVDEAEFGVEVEIVQD